MSEILELQAMEAGPVDLGFALSSLLSISCCNQP